MLFDDQTIIADFCVIYRARDLIACMQFFTDDVVYMQYIDRQLAPFAGASIGRETMMRRLTMIAEQFELLDYRLLSAQQSNDSSHASVAYHFRHKETGEDIAGTMRLVCVIRGDQFCRIEEHHDRSRVEAFLRLVKSIEDERDQCGAPT